MAAGRDSEVEAQLDSRNNAKASGRACLRKVLAFMQVSVEGIYNIYNTSPSKALKTLAFAFKTSRNF